METLLHDLRTVLRGLRRAPAHALAVVLTLGLGIGATTAIFSVVNGVLLNPLPYRDADRLFVFQEQSPQTQRLPAYLTFLDYRSEARSFDGVGYVIGEAGSLRTESGVAWFGHARVSDGFFGVLGTTPLLGRVLGTDDERPGAVPAAVISYSLWRGQFAGDPHILGRALKTAEAEYTVVGVLPPGAAYPTWADVYSSLSIGATPPAMSRRDVHVDGTMIARLKPGVAAAAAGSELELLGRRFAEAYPKENAGFRGAIVPLTSVVVGSTTRAPLMLLLAATFLLLVIGCVNVTNLTLARLAERTREMALRTALGAGRHRLVRQLLGESLLLAGLGAVLGVLVAVWMVHLISAAGGGNLVASGLAGLVPRLEEIRFDGRVFAAAVAVTLLSGLAAGLVPALTGSRPDLAGVLKEGGARGGLGKKARSGRRALIAAQTCLAVALLVTSGLLINSFWRLTRVDRGFRSEGLLTVHVTPSPRYVAPTSDVAALYRRLTATVRALPGVTSVGIINHLPLGGGWNGTKVGIDGAPPAAGEDLTVGLRAADEPYLQTMGISLIKGRWFGSGDMTHAGTGSIVINQAMATRFWPDQDPLGHRVSFFKSAAGRADFGQPLDGTVVGVVGDVRQFGLDQPSDAAIYVPYTVNPWGHSYLVIRTVVPPASLAQPVRRALIAEEPDLVVNQLDTMDNVVAGSLVGREFLVLLLGAFAASALSLAMVGLYGVLTRLVKAQERELGIRRAIGAEQGAIIRLVLWEGMGAVALGAVLGLGVAWVSGRALSSQLYGVTAADPATYLVTLLVMLGVALLACSLPAWRAARVEPTVALRSE